VVAIDTPADAAAATPFNWWDSVHVLNRRVGRLPLFEKPGDYSAFEKVLHEAYTRTQFRIAAHCLMPNHWHLLLWPRTDGELSNVSAGSRSRIRKDGMLIGKLPARVLYIRDGSNHFQFKPTSTF
jgi:hypothetical protein